ncbi:MAG: hypothetical protein RLZZ416_823 [Candidatus Parcubacteria bacterium]
MNFWKELPKPFFALAPLEDVTDAAFRRLVAECGKPDVTFTEFTSADGLLLADANGKRRLEKKLSFCGIERPIVAQLFTAAPEHMEKAARLCAALQFDGIDINMGCPDRSVEKSGCGAALIKTPEKARELIRAAARAGLPVSLKTRLGYDKDELETWLPELLAEEPAAITIHARTRREMSDVPARWERIARAVEIRDEAGASTLIIGNGDVRDLEDARAKAIETKCDGIMLGRAIFGNPWLFAARDALPAPRERLEALARHLQLFDEILGDTHYAVMKKHFKAYVSGWSGSKELRAQLMSTHTAADAISLLQKGREIIQSCSVA